MSQTAITSLSHKHLWPLLIGMTAVQAAISAAVFGLGVAAPLIGISAAQLGLLNALIFAIGAWSSSQAGLWCLRYGPVHVVCACLLLVLIACSALTLPWAGGVWIAAILLGLAFGPETPASSAALVRVARTDQRNWVIALRQTGNQWGAIAASLALPALLLQGRSIAFMVMACVAAVVLIGVSRLRSADATASGSALPSPPLLPAQGLVAVLREQCRQRGMPALLCLAASYAAMQIAINGFAFSYLVRVLALPPMVAGALLATAQTAGLIARLLMSAWARRASSCATMLGWIGPGIGVSVLVLANVSPTLGAVPLSCLMFCVGFLVSGWNGLLLAELARLAGTQRTASWTGAAMTVSYLGLVCAPLLFMAAGTHMRIAYGAIALLCAASGAAVLLTRPQLPATAIDAPVGDDCEQSVRL